MPELRAVRKCYHKGVYYKPGDTLFVVQGEKAPRHFIPATGFSPEAIKKAEEADLMAKKKVNIKPNKA